MTDQPIITRRPLPDRIRYFVNELMKRAAVPGANGDLELGGIAFALSMTADEAENEVAALTLERDGAYRERAQLLAWLAALHPAVIAPASDVDEDGWQILYLTPEAGGQMSWHIAPRDAGLLAHVERVEPDDPRAQWDGHTTEEKYQRIRSMPFGEMRAVAPYVEPVLPETADPIEITPWLAIQRYRTDHGAWAWCMRCWGNGTCEGELALDLSSRRYAEQKAQRHRDDHHTTLATPEGS